jgi:hypothetical protein
MLFLCSAEVCWCSFDSSKPSTAGALEGKVLQLPLAVLPVPVNLAGLIKKTWKTTY